MTPSNYPVIKVIRAAWTRGGEGEEEERGSRCGGVMKKNCSALETSFKQVREVAVNYEACVMKRLGRVDGSSG